MATKEFSVWYKDVYVDVPNCPSDVVINAVRSAAIEFCRRTWIYKKELDPITTEPNEGAYELDVPKQTKVCKILQAWFNGTELTPADFDFLHSRYTDWRTQSAAEPEYYTQENQDEITIVPRPESSVIDAIKVHVALMPSRDATTIDAVIAEHYFDPITYGAKARLLMMRDRPWTDLSLAAGYAAGFNDAISSVRMKSDKGLVRSRPRVRASFF